MLFLSLRLRSVPNRCEIGDGIALVVHQDPLVRRSTTRTSSRLNSLNSSCFLLLDAFRALKQVKARRRAATTTLTSADRHRRRNIKNSLGQTLVWSAFPLSRVVLCFRLTGTLYRVLYIALESTTRKAAFLVPFYGYWNLLVLWIITQKSQYVLNRVVKIVTPYEFLFDFLGVVLATMIDFIALVPKYINQRWRGVVDSTSHQVSQSTVFNVFIC